MPKPGSAGGYRFEEKSAVIGGKTGYADVFMRGVFAWENKAPGKSLDTALKPLRSYNLALAKLRAVLWIQYARSNSQK